MREGLSEDDCLLFGGDRTIIKEELSFDTPKNPTNQNQNPHPPKPENQTKT